MQILEGINAQFEPIARGEIDTPATEDEAPAASQEQPIFANDDDDEVAFESARESVGADAHDESAMEGIEDTMITEPTPSKHMEDKENRALPTPSDEDMWEADEI